MNCSGADGSRASAGVNVALSSQLDLEPIVGNLDARPEDSVALGRVLKQDRVGVVDVNERLARTVEPASASSVPPGPTAGRVPCRVRSASRNRAGRVRRRARTSRRRARDRSPRTGRARCRRAGRGPGRTWRRRRCASRNTNPLASSSTPDPPGTAGRRHRPRTARRRGSTRRAGSLAPVERLPLDAAVALEDLQYRIPVRQRTPTPSSPKTRTGAADSRRSSSPAVWSISASVRSTPANGGARTRAER